MKSSLTVAFVIIALSLAVWVFFDIVTVGLTAGETSVVVGFCAAVVLFSRWTWNRIREARKAKREKKNA